MATRLQNAFRVECLIGCGTGSVWQMDNWTLLSGAVFVGEQSAQCTQHTLTDLTSEYQSFSVYSCLTRFLTGRLRIGRLRSVSQSVKTLRAKLQSPLHGHRLRTFCTTPPTDELTTILQQICHIAMPEPNISTCEDVGMWQIFVRWWWICCTTSCRIVVSSSVGGVRTRSRCPCSGVRH